jgi:hypothetical protein
MTALSLRTVATVPEAVALAHFTTAYSMVSKSLTLLRRVCRFS